MSTLDNIFPASANFKKLVNLLALFNLFTTVALFTLLLIACNRAIDFIDEGFYLNWISNPWIYDLFTTQFGFFYNPIYRFLDKDLILLRQSNVILNFFLAFTLLWILLINEYQNKSTLVKVTSAIAFASLAFLILIRTDSWMPTPSYNTLTFQGAVIFFIGLLLDHYNKKSIHYVGVILIGVAGWIMFMGKPPSAAIFGIIWVIYQIFSHKNKRAFRAVMLAGLTSALLVVSTAYIISGSINNYIEALLNGLKGVNLFDAGHAKSLLELFRIDSIYFSTNAKLVLAIIFLISFLYFTVIYKRYKNTNSIFLLTLPFLALTFALLVCFGYPVPGFLKFRFYPLVYLSMVIGILVSMFINGRAGTQQINSPNFSLALIAFVTPYILAVGSANNYWQIGSSAAFFWGLSLLLLIKQEQNSDVLDIKLISLSAYTLMLVTLIINISQIVPYNQLTKLSRITYPVKVRDTTNELLVRKDMHKYINNLYRVSRSMGFLKNTPMIDLTGHYGTSLYLLSAKSIGLPYMFGGYDGSDAYAKFALNKVSCEDLANAWLLVENEGYRSISSSLLDSFGMNVDMDYIASEGFDSIVNPPNSRWGGATNQVFKHQLLKPIHIERNIKLCEEKINNF